MPGRAGVPKSRARAGERPACAVEGDHPVGPTMGTIWRAARGGDLCPIRTSASRIPGPVRSHKFAPSPRRGAAFFRVTSPQGRARSPAPTALPAPRSPVGGQVHRDNTQRRDSALGGHPPSAVCDEPNVLVDPIRSGYHRPAGVRGLSDDRRVEIDDRLATVAINDRFIYTQTLILS